MSVIVASGAATRMAAEEAVARSDCLLSARIVPPFSAIALPIAAPVPDVVPMARKENQCKRTERINVIVTNFSRQIIHYICVSVLEVLKFFQWSYAGKCCKGRTSPERVLDCTNMSEP